MLCAGAAKLSCMSSDLSASFFVCDESFGRYFCSLAFAFSVTGSFMCSDLFCSASMSSCIHSTMSKDSLQNIYTVAATKRHVASQSFSPVWTQKQSSKRAQPHHATDWRAYLVKWIQPCTVVSMNVCVTLWGVGVCLMFQSLSICVIQLSGL